MRFFGRNRRKCEKSRFGHFSSQIPYTRSMRLKMSHFAGNRQLLRPLETPDRLKTLQMCVSTERPALGECFEKYKVLSSKVPPLNRGRKRKNDVFFNFLIFFHFCPQASKNSCFLVKKRGVWMSFFSHFWKNW